MAVVSADDVTLVQLPVAHDGALGQTVVLLDAGVERGVVVHLARRARLRLAPCTDTVGTGAAVRPTQTPTVHNDTQPKSTCGRRAKTAIHGRETSRF